MARLTYNGVRAALLARGIDAELVRGEGYHYFVGPSVEFALGTSVYAFRLNHLTLDQWIVYAEEFAAESKLRAPEPTQH